MLKVKDLITKLQNFDPEATVCIRTVSKEGFFADHKLLGPDELYPHGTAYLSVGEPITQINAKAS
jgi:hypothetical protein